MNKRLLFLMSVPIFLLASCNNSGGVSSEYKKVSYLSINGNSYINEDGTAITYYDIATYKFKDADYAEITSVMDSSLTLPKEVAIVYNTRAIQAINGVVGQPFNDPYEFITLQVTGLFTKNYTMDLKKDSEASYKYYQEFFYNEAKRTIKATIHENVKDASSKASYTSAYLTYGSYLSVYLEGEGGKFNKYEPQSRLMNLNERSFERYMVIGSDYDVTFAYKEENK